MDEDRRTPCVRIEWRFTFDAATGGWCRRIISKAGLEEKISALPPNVDLDLTETTPSQAPEAAAQWIFYQEVAPVRWIPHVSEAGENFQHIARLQSDQIRLLNLALNESDTIHAVIATFDLHNTPAYIAISYVCGTDERVHKIFVNSRRFLIKPNLLAALKQMKCLSRNGMLGKRGSGIPLPATGLWVWADAICINQEDITEKAAQVREMHEVYRKSLAVVISLHDRTAQGDRLGEVCTWLEDEDEMRPIKSMIKQSPILQESFPEPPIVLRRLGAKQLVSEPPIRASYEFSKDMLEALYQSVVTRCNGPDLPPGAAWNSFCTNATFWSDCLDIFQHEWFSRVWTCQEVRLGLAGNGASVFLGSACVNWRTLSSLYLLMMFDLEPDQLEGMGWELSRLKMRIRDLRNGNIINELSVPHLRTDIWHLLVATTQRRATDSKDHIYAMLGLMPSEIREIIKPEYTLTDAEVFVQALRAAISLADGASELPLLWEQLCFVTPDTDGLPSWCPGFKHEPRARSTVFSQKTLSWQVVEYFSNFVGLCPGSSKDPMILNTIIVDSVAMVFNVPCPPIFTRNLITQELIECQQEWLLSLYGYFADSGSHNDGYGADLEDFLLSFHDPRVQAPLCSCFSFGAFLSRSSTPCKKDDNLEAQPQDQQRLFLKNVDLSDDTSDHPAPPSNKEHASARMCSQQHGEYEWYFTQNMFVWTAMLGDTYIFKTSDGRFGNSPRLPTPGDSIYVVPNGQLLHMFAAGETTRYKGAASVHGLMGDSLLTAVEEAEQSLRKLVIH